MKIDEEPVDEVKDALVSFFERQGGYTQVAKKIGGNPQQLHYIVTGRNAPTLKTVMRILRYYPNEAELRKALSLPMVEVSINGESSHLAHEPINSEMLQQLAAKDKLINDLLQELRESKEELKEARKELSELSRDFRDLAKLNFPESGSHTTAFYDHNQNRTFTPVRRAGFFQKKDDAYSRFLPDVRYNKPASMSGLKRLRIN